MTDLKWTAWQLADSAFPAGGFAHSGGLEAAIQSGAIGDAESLGLAMRAVLNQAAFGALPAVLAVVQDPRKFAEVERRLDAVLTNHVVYRASVAQGQALLSAGPRIFRVESLSNWASDCRKHGRPGHLASVFGYLAACLGMDARQASHLFLFTSMRSALSAAVRLGAIGPIAAQTLLQELIPEAHRLADQALSLTLDDLHQTLPLFDILQSGQDRLYSRLFQS
ncbi:MAG: urease accessory UreF family protein [Planctomycetota bacterium]